MVEQTFLLKGNEEYQKLCKVSICIPAYGRIETLKQAIDSILNQTEKNKKYCLIISEDHSDKHEKIKDLIMSYETEKILYYYNPVPKGMTGNWNCCFELANTEYVALLHDDDYLYPNYVSTIFKIIESKNTFDLMLFQHDLLVFDKIDKTTSKIKNIYNNLQRNRWRRIKQGNFIFGGADGIIVPTCGILFKRKPMLEFGGYRKEYGYSADHSFVAEFCKKHKVYFYNKTVSVYRYAETNITNQGGTKKAFVIEKQEMRKRIAEENMIYSIIYKMFSEGMFYESMGPYIKHLKIGEKNDQLWLPGFIVTKRGRRQQKCFEVVKRLYIYGQGIINILFGKRYYEKKDINL